MQRKITLFMLSIFFVLVCSLCCVEFGTYYIKLTLEDEITSAYADVKTKTGNEERAAIYDKTDSVLSIKGRDWAVY